ncbi:MAG: hypothetical protein OEM97_04800 [Acidimicrobiia bacterium]|nr:hypothetical protein [Acidimicrobiia bacterium]
MPAAHVSINNTRGPPGQHADHRCVRRRTGVDAGQVYVNVDEYGSTGSASVPLALAFAVQEGRIQSGDLVVLTAFGAGFHWACSALQF